MKPEARNSPTELPPAEAQHAAWSAVGVRRLVPRLRAKGYTEVRRRRWPGTRRTLLQLRGVFNPFSLQRERRVVDKRPLYWLASLTAMALLPLLSGDVLLLSAAAVVALYAAINVIWMLVIGTAGIFSLATMAIVGLSAYACAWLSVAHGLPWWGMPIAGMGVGFLCGVVVALPANRLEGFYYALLTLGLAELCRVSVVQSRALGASTGGLYGAASYVPEAIDSDLGVAAFSYLACFAAMLAALGVYRVINGRRLGRLLAMARENEAFAEAIGIDYARARVQVFLISSAALGAIGGFYASHFKGASPSLFSLDTLLLSLAMIVIGGLGRAEGAVVGTVLVVLIDKLGLEWGPWRLVAIGALMLATVLFTRGGLFGIKTQFIAWRDRLRSERRALRQQKGGEFMPEEATAVRDKDQLYIRRFDKLQRDRLKATITPQLIAEHQAHPIGQNSDALERLSNYFRRSGMVDKYAIQCDEPFRRYRLMAFSGVRGVPPRSVDDRVYTTLPAAVHAVFLKRVADLMES